MTPPSKELLNAVLGVKILDDLCPIHIEGDKVKYCAMHEYAEYTAPKIFDINAYELAYRVKVWALEQGYLIVEMDKYLLILLKGKGVTKHRIDNTLYSVADVGYSNLFDISSVFKAGEWILNQQDKGI